MPADHRRFIGYPTDHLLAVLPDEAAARELRERLLRLGIPEGDVVLLHGEHGAHRLDGTGSGHGIAARLRRLVSFTVMDQLVDMAMYERAVLDGSVVAMVKVRGDERKASVLAAVRSLGGHFANYYGRFATEELERWRGPEPDIAPLLRR